MQVWLYAIAIIAAACGTWFLTFLFARYYIDPRHKTFLTLFVTSLALAVSALTLALIPIDVYTVSSGTTSAGGHSDIDELANLQRGLRILYYGFYLASAVFCFVLLPFAYFYFEEDAGEEGSTPGRCFRATKFTLGFVIVFAILIGCGFIVKQGAVADDADWRDRLEKNFTNVEQLIAFIVSILGLLGLAAFVVNVGYGLVMIPAGLWRSRAASSAVDSTALLSEQESLDQQIRAKEQEITYIRTADQAELGQNGGSASRYGGATQFRSQYAREAALSRGAGSSREAREATAAVRREQRELERRKVVNAAHLEHDKSAAGRCASFWRASAPLRYIVALLACLLTVAIVAQVLLSTVDRVKHSKCKWSCGFSLPEATKPYFNPLDQFFVAVAPAFPVDLVFFGGMILYLFVCALTGLAALGVRVLCIKLYPIRAHGTPANGLVMGTWLMMLVALVINQQMLSFAPRYTAFGTQTYLLEGKRTTCSPSVAELIPGVCVFTELSKFLYRTNNRMPFFGVVQFFASILMLVVVAVSFLYALCRSKASWNASKAQSDDPDAVGYVGYGK